MERIETSQMQNDEAERMRGVIESGVFDSDFGANMGSRTMTIDALRTP